MVATFRSAWRRALATGEFQSSDGSIGENGCAAACGVTFDLQSPPLVGDNFGRGDVWGDIPLDDG